MSPDSVERHVRFTEELGLDFPLLADPEHVAQELYSVRRLRVVSGKEVPVLVRSTFLIDAEGVVRRTWRGVKVAGHAAEVLAAAAELP